jgi:hypothetical protein
MGAGDEVPAALRQLGVDITFLSADDLARTDLSGFDAIVTGVRAYNVRKDLRANQPRLLDYVQNGGTMIVQYNVAPGGFAGGNPKLLEKIGPYPIQVSNDRVTVETAPLKPTKPDLTLLEAPNRINERDYQAGSRSAAFTSRGPGTPTTRPSGRPAIRARRRHKGRRSTRAMARASTFSRRCRGSANCPREFRARIASSRIF